MAKRGKRKNGVLFKIAEYFCTEKRPFAFIVSALSAVMAIGYIIYAVVCLVKIDSVKSSIGDMWGFAYIANVGLYTVFSVLGIVLFGTLGLYRVLMCYFYGKLHKCDVVFYKGRLGETVLFSVFSFIMAAVFFFCANGEKIKLPFLNELAVRLFAWAYILVGALPLVERVVCSVFVAAVEKTGKAEAPQIDDITEELELDAQKTAEIVVENKNTSFEEKKFGKFGGVKANEEVTEFGINTSKPREKKDEKIGSYAETSREDGEIVRKYGKAAGRLAKKFRELEDDD